MYNIINSKKGFSLVEMMVSVAIIGVLTTIGAVSIIAARNYSYKRAAFSNAQLAQLDATMCSDNSEGLDAILGNATGSLDPEYFYDWVAPPNTGRCNPSSSWCVNGNVLNNGWGQGGSAQKPTHNICYSDSAKVGNWPELPKGYIYYRAGINSSAPAPLNNPGSGIEGNIQNANVENWWFAILKTNVVNGNDGKLSIVCDINGCFDCAVDDNCNDTSNICNKVSTNFSLTCE